MNPWVQIIAVYGLPFALALKELLAAKPDPSAEDFLELQKKYGSESLEAKLAKLQNPPV